MEDWQIRHIQKNRSKLCEFTDCNALFLAEINHFECLSKHEEKMLEAKRQSEGEVAQAKSFYDIAVTRTGMYEYLLASLIKTKQTGAFKILFNECIAHCCFISTKIQLSYNWWKGCFCSEIESFKFSNTNHFKFLDELLKDHCKVVANLLKQKEDNDDEFVRKWLHACVIENSFHLLKIMGGCQKHLFASKDLVILAVKHADVNVIDLVSEHFVQQTNSNLPEMELELQNKKSGASCTISLLNIAALRGSLHIMKHLLEKYFNTAKMERIIHHCVVDTQLQQNSQIYERKCLVDHLLKTQPTLLHSKTAHGHTPLLYPNIHLDLVMHLISLGVDLYATNKNSKNILHFYPQYMTTQDYDKLIRHLDNKGESKIFHSLDKWKCSPLYRAVMYLEVLDSTLRVFTAAKVDFNATNTNQNTPLVRAVMSHRSVHLLKSLIKAGADVIRRDQTNPTLSCIALAEGNLAALNLMIFTLLSTQK